MTINHTFTPGDDAAWYQVFTGKPSSSRRPLPAARDALVNEHARILAAYPDSTCRCSKFFHALCAVTDMYEAYLDAACDLTDEEIDELCCRIMLPRDGFNRNLRIAKIQKQAPSEIVLGKILGKKWASDPSLLVE